MTKQIWLIALCCFLAACGGNNNTQVGKTFTPTEQGDRYYGGVFKMNETEFFRSLYPLNVTEVVGHRITNQLYEGLVSLKQEDLSITPCLAESWEVNDAATEYVFKIRQEVRFHDDPCFPDGKGRLMNAHDIKYCLDQLCTPDANNQGFWVFKDLVVGASAHYNAQMDGQTVEGGVSGITVVDDHTLKIELERPFASFLYKLSLPFAQVYPKEAKAKYGNEMRSHAVGTGPFRLKKVMNDESVILVKHPNYWGTDDMGNTLPYLDGIKFSFIKEEKVELLEFQKGNVDMKYRLPLEMIVDIKNQDGSLTPEFSKFQLQEASEMTVQYYGYLHLHPVFKDKRIRQAFNYAIDRQKIVDFTLKGQGIPASGMVPSGFKDFNNDNVMAYDFQPEKARALLAEAGFENGEGFPTITLQINSGGGRNEQIAEAIQNMLEETLNINIEITKLVWAQHTETLELAKVGFYRLGWVADYPDPENFLNLMMSKHVPATTDEKAYINSFRYKSEAYDKIMEQALQTLDDAERNRLYEKADNQAMEDAVIMSIYYPINNRLLQPYVRNFPQNPMEYRNLRDVYMTPH